MSGSEANARFGGAGAIRTREVLTLRIPSRFVYVKPVRTFVTVTADLAGFSEDKVEEIGLVVTEVFNNAIEYGSEGPRDSVNVACILHPDKMVIKIKDKGRRKVNFDRLLKNAQTPKPIDNLDQRGRGLFLIGKLSDDLSIKSTPGKGTEVTVTKLK